MALIVSFTARKEALKTPVVMLTSKDVLILAMSLLVPCFSAPQPTFSSSPYFNSFGDKLN